MMRGLMLPLALLSVAATPVQTPAETAIRATMAASAAGWNAGDLARFMDIYADDAVFVTPKGVLRGKEAISARYQPSFRGAGTGGGNTRGTLSFAFLEMRGLDPRHAMLVARWTLTGPSSTETGMTSVVFERRGAAWQIIADHSS